ncbi:MULTISPECIES: hypothetical protein [unclassified Uliginosibacterium]|uniref:hypothetical protein n=1 Tax=unclassified Uliginosibacterium TaxID=2621521 RepID=UPI000C7AD555|nr:MULTISPECIES: hypothetical protein [unclassified Uliginosibacterium]MDO6386089.1 hypothetical protein [Uliginosibacterium sp. 31-12]PLK49156.1 hypothetical protein C0V76_08115 [Uliginosibacterium sp. TH139]
MKFWNGSLMYAPRSPEYYAIPGTEHCIFRLMYKYQDAVAWNLYWLTKPQTDLIPLHPQDWHRYYESFSGQETRAFYDALDTVVLNSMTLATIMARPPREAIRLLRGAHLERTRFYQLAGGEAWRSTLLGRLFLAERLSDSHNSSGNAGNVVLADFILHRYTRPGSTEYKQIRRPA